MPPAGDEHAKLLLLFAIIIIVSVLLTAVLLMRISRTAVSRTEAIIILLMSYTDAPAHYWAEYTLINFLLFYYRLIIITKRHSLPVLPVVLQTLEGGLLK